jgi:hypothetical protein
MRLLLAMSPQTDAPGAIRQPILGAPRRARRRGYRGMALRLAERAALTSSAPASPRG